MTFRHIDILPIGNASRSMKIHLLILPQAVLIAYYLTYRALSNLK